MKARRLQSMRKLFCLMLVLSVPVLANNDEEARVKTAVEDRYQQWLAAAHRSCLPEPCSPQLPVTRIHIDLPVVD